MTQGKIQLAPQGSSSLDKRVITISRPQRPDPAADVDDPLFVNVIRRRWMLLAFCVLLSGLAAGLVAYKFELPKATTAGKLRYVALPPSLQELYTAPKTLELAEMLQSNENMSELGKRVGLQMDPKDLNRRFDFTATRYSNIINVEFRWRDGKNAIDILNELMRIACETTAANRKNTLQQYGVETELQLEAAKQRVQQLRDHVAQLHQEQHAQLSANGALGSEVDRLLRQLEHTEQALDTLTLKRVSLNRQLATLQSGVSSTRQQIKEQLLNGRREQILLRQRLYNPNSEKYAILRRIEQQLASFEQSTADLDFNAWRARLDAIGAEMLGNLEPDSMAAVASLEKQLGFKEAKIEEVEFELLPIDGELSLLENRRESQERRLADFTGTVDVSSTALAEAEDQLAEATDTRARLNDTLAKIRRGEDTDFSEMKIMTPASWQTTEESNGKLKLLVFTFAGCLTALVLPVFALEHFFPSGDPADHAAKALGIPRVSRGTFVSQPVKNDRRNLHPVNSEAVRLLALRIQQSVHGPGAMVLFSGLNHDKSSIPMISYLAECLSRREEKVLIIDACDRPSESNSRTDNQESVDAVLTPKDGDSEDATVDSSETASLPVNLGGTAPGVVGISDFLRRRDLGPDQMICPTSIPGVDIIPSGTTAFPREGLASSSLTGLLEECRRRYTMILVAGPSTQHPSDLQMLSARADGILFTVPPTGRPAGQGEDVVRDLLDMGAPVIGIVS